MKKVETHRDLVIMREEGRLCISAVDSCGGIGPKPGDVLTCPLEIVGHTTARVPLFEVLAAGARPAFASISVCSDEKTAEGLLLGIRTAFSPIGGLPFVISTEKNMATSMTGLGVSVTGFCGEDTLRIGKARLNDLLCCLGRPLSGTEVLANMDKMLTLSDMNALLKNPAVSSVLPAGSKGVAHEALLLAGESGLAAHFTQTEIDLEKSAGPASCTVFSCGADFINDTGLPVFIIGKLCKK